MEKAKRILILSGVFPPDIGGPATFLDPLARALIKKGYQVRILTFGKKREKTYPYPIKRISSRWPNFLKKIIYFKWGLWYGLRADILYNQDLYTAGLTSLLIKKILKKPLITRFVGDSAWEKFSSERLIGNDDIITFQRKKYNWRVELSKKLRSKILTNSDRVIVASNFLKKVAEEIGLPSKKIKVIYNSVDFLEIKPSLSDKIKLRQKLGLKKDDKVLLTIARLTPWKGVDFLINLLPDLIKKYTQISLVVAGKGPEMAYLKEISHQLNLDKNIFFTGKLNRQEVVDYLAAADLFVLNTNYEGMSYTILEAFKAGIPVITTPAGGNPEVVQDKETGLLVGFCKKKEWLEAISLLLDNVHLAEKLKKQARESLRKFSWERFVLETINIFEEVA